MPDLIRHPCLLTEPHEDWIADQVRNDKAEIGIPTSSRHQALHQIAGI